MHRIRGVLSQKETGEIWSVSPGDTVLEAITLMAQKRIGAVLVMEGDKLVGILSERDYARKIILEGRRSAETRVSEIMTRNVVTVGPELSAREGLALMTQRRFRHLPVMDGARLVGLVSIGDLVKTVIAEQEDLIDQLERYVSGSA